MERDDLAKAHEEGLALFVASEWRPRFRESLGREKLRSKLRLKLAHFRHLDHRFLTPVRSGKQTADSLGQELRKRGAGDRCHIVSEDVEIDGKAMRLDDALQEIVEERSIYATFISCIPGRLAYFHDEETENRHILARPN